jgi:hypothetical protein
MLHAEYSSNVPFVFDFIRRYLSVGVGVGFVGTALSAASISKI